MLAAAIVAHTYYGDNGTFGYDWFMFYYRVQSLSHGISPYTVQPVFFISTPQVLALVRAFLPLGLTASWALWVLLSACMLLASVVLTADALGWRPGPLARALGLWWLLAYIPTVLLLLCYAQFSALVVLGYALALWLFTRGHEGPAGAALGLALVAKPQLAFLTLPLLLYKRRWRASLACLASCLVLTGMTLLVVGWHTFQDYITVQRILWDWSLNDTGLQFEVPGIHDLFTALWPRGGAPHWLEAALTVAFVAGLAWFWRGPWQPQTPRFAIGWALLIVVTLLTATYCHYYDVVLLLGPMVTLVALGHRDGTGPTSVRRWIVPAILGLYLGPELRMLYRLHLMVPALLLALIVLWRLAAPPPASDRVDALRIP